MRLKQSIYLILVYFELIILSIFKKNVIFFSSNKASLYEHIAEKTKKCKRKKKIENK